jgi:hypothetical protein
MLQSACSSDLENASLWQLHIYTKIGHNVRREDQAQLEGGQKPAAMLSKRFRQAIQSATCGGYN